VFESAGRVDVDEKYPHEIVDKAADMGLLVVGLSLCDG